jgi:MYXO-CTERM domain-containing protein
MKTLLPITLLVLAGTTVASAQSDRQPVTENRSDNEAREHHNYGWIGLIGLAGLTGLRRKSEQSALHSRLESDGVNVKTARV